MTYPSKMPYLSKALTTCFMDCIVDLLPSNDLVLIPYSGSVRPLRPGKGRPDLRGIVGVDAKLDVPLLADEYSL